VFFFSFSFLPVDLIVSYLGFNGQGLSYDSGLQLTARELDPKESERKK